MTKETKDLVVRRLYGYMCPVGGDALGQEWHAAIDEAMAYCNRNQPVQGRLLRLKYFCALSDEASAAQLGISRATYQKHKAEALGTVMEYAARRGLI